MTAVLTAASTILCPHKLPITLASAQTLLKVNGDAVITRSDLTTRPITPCTFANAPCTKITEITQGVATTLKVGDDPVLLQSAQGTTNQGSWTILPGGQTKLEAT